MDALRVFNASSTVKIIYLGNKPTVHDRRFLEAFRAWQWDVTAAFVGGEPIGVADVPPGIRLEHVGSTLGDTVRLVRHMIRRGDPDIVHAGPLHSAGYVAALAGASHCLAAVSWGFDILVEARSSPSARRAVLTALEASRLVVTDCETVTAAARELAAVPAERFITIPWGTDPARFVPHDERGERASSVLSVRSWEPMYRGDVLLEAFAIALRSVPHLRLVYGGSGSQETELLQLIRTLGIRKYVDTPGFLSANNLERAYRQADIYVSCADQDGSSVSLLEAMASCLTCVVTDNPSNREWVTSGETGFLAEPRNPQSFANAIMHAAALTALEREALGRRARTRILERADWRRNLPRLKTAYEGMAAGSRLTC